jgi:Lrp/AsnC family leucine-responsive transcriptional regulator
MKMECRYATVPRRGLAASARLTTGNSGVPQAIRGEMPPELDELDRRILALLQQDARRSAELIGAGIGLSASAVQRRITRLREEKVITAEVAIVDPRTVGRGLTVIVDIEVERERPELLAMLKRWMAAEPAIQEAWYVTGDSDFVLIVTARDVEDYDSLLQRLVSENANVRRFRTRVALGTLKRGCTVPVDES